MHEKHEAQARYQWSNRERPAWQAVSAIRPIKRDADPMTSGNGSRAMPAANGE